MTSAARSALRAGFVVVDGDGRILAATGDEEDPGAGWPTEAMALVRRILAGGAGEEARFTLDGREWQVAGLPGRGADGRPAASLWLAPVCASPWAAQASLEAQKHQALRRLVSALVHELRNPLTGIALVAELLALRRDLPGDARARLDEVQQHVERAEEVLKSLKRFSREEPGAMSLVSLNDLVKEATQLERGVIEGRSISFVLDLDANLPEVFADPSQLRLVVANLVRNAAEAIAGQGRAGSVRLRTSHCYGVVRLTVEDDGPGVLPEVLGRIFDPYFTTKEHGTGVGLAMSKGIVRAHGGHIRAENRRGGGARFLVDLPDPQHSTPAQMPNALGVDLAPAPAHSVLVVDADEGRLERTRHAIAATGWKVHVADSAAAALRKLAISEFDVVLVAGDGGEEAVELCARWRLQHAGARGRFLVLLEREPAEDLRTRLLLAGGRVSVGAADAAGLLALVREVVAAG